MRKPNRFVSLHNHTHFSPADGLGDPIDHFKWCLGNGINSHAITDHGNMSAYCHAYLAQQELNKGGPVFKYLPGVESYFHPSLEQWAKDKAEHEAAETDRKVALKLRKQQEKIQTEIVARVDEDDEAEQIETANALTIENEDDTKNVKHFNPVNRRSHLVMLAKDDVGLQQLFHLTSRSYLDGFYRFPRMDVKMMKSILKGGHVVASSACVGGLISYSIFQTLQGFKFDELSPDLLDDPFKMEACLLAVGNSYEMMIDIFGKDNYFLELQFNKLPAQDLTNRAIIEFARRNGITNQLDVTCDAHYYNPEVWKEREIYRKMAFMNYEKFDPSLLPQSKDDLKCELYPKNAEQIWDEYMRSKDRCSFYDDVHDEIICDAIERSYDIAHQVLGEVKPDTSIKLPRSLIPEGSGPMKHLTQLCLAGLKRRGLADKPEYIERLKEELNVMKHLQVAEYFITMAKIVDLAREVVLMGPGRGSGAGSLVNYVLYITDMDPIKWDLPFARFMSIYRKGMPDIDSDFSDRDKVLDVMRKQFGFENVVPISNYNTFKLKSLVKDLAKFYGISFEESNAATRTVEDEVKKATQKQGDDKNLFILKLDDSMEHSKSFRDFMEKYPQIYESIKVLLNQNKSLGRHAGGVLVCDDLPSKMPLITSRGEPQSPWVEGLTYKHLEKVCNFVKIDILGLESLRLIERTIELILKRQGMKNPQFKDVRAWFDEHMDLNKIDLDDQKVYEYVYHSARWAGIFQCTSPGAQRFFVKSKPCSIHDIAALTAIYRPGPLGAHVDKLWLGAGQGEEFDWGDKRINEILKKTRGLLVFQEGVMTLCEQVAGWPKAKSDEARRAILKRSVAGAADAKAAINEMQLQFVDGAEKLGYPRPVAEALYEKIRYFSGYAFNAAHSYSYAIDSYYCAWLLTHHEPEWLCAYLEANSNNPDDRAMAFAQVKSMGYEVVGIDVNYATHSWTIIEGKKFMPSFLSCKGMGSAAAEEVIAMRPYESIENMLWDENGEWKHSKFNKRSMEALICIGGVKSLDCVGEDRIFSSYKHMHHVVIENMDKIKKTSKKDPQLGQKNFYEIARETCEEFSEEWTRKELVQFQIEYFGSVDVQSLLGPGLLSRLVEKGIPSIDKVQTGEKSIAWFVAQSLKRKQTKTKKTYGEIEALSPSGKIIKLKAWGVKEDFVLEPFTIYLGEIDRNEWGCSTQAWRLKKLGI